jgi:hypothetical protein
METLKTVILNLVQDLTGDKKKRDAETSSA